MKSILFIILIIPFLTFAQKQDFIWDFPVNPETEEWKTLKNYSDRLSAYNIPEDILGKMNTEELVKTCLTYPEFRLILTKNSLQEGYTYLKSIFNGFSELEKRSDGGIELLKEYQNLNPTEIRNFNTPLERGRFAFQIKYIEILLAQKPILVILDTESKKEIIKQCISKYEEIEKMPEYYATFGMVTPGLLLTRLLDINNYSDFVTKKLANDNIQGFINTSILVDSTILPDILSLSKEYLKQLENE